MQIVGADSDWSIATDIADNSAFASAVSIIGVHYPCTGGDGGSADTLPGQRDRGEHRQAAVGQRERLPGP